MAALGPRLRGVLRLGLPLLPTRFHAPRRLARRLGSPGAPRIHRRSAPTTAPRGAAGARHSVRNRGGLPRRVRGPHALRGPQAEQAAEQGNELLQRAPLPPAGGDTALSDPTARWIQDSGAVARELAQGNWVCLTLFRCRESRGALVLVFVWDLGIYCYFDLGVEFSIVKVLCWRLLALICFYFIRLV
jgi:hypothetical protein